MFNPMFTPKQMLELGVFDGGYFNDDMECLTENGIPHCSISPTNIFASDVSQSREKWINNGWITPEDPLGWFQWYVRYHNGRRIDELDKFQIGRWKSFVARHSAQVRKNGNGDLNKRIRQRQCLLHWAADPIPDVEEIKDKFEFLMEMKSGKM